MPDQALPTLISRFVGRARRSAGGGPLAMESMNALIVPLNALVRPPSHASRHHPAMRGDLARVRELAQEDPARVHATDPFMRTPLITAARGGHVNVVQYLLQHGANIHHVDNGGSTALHEACFKGRREVVALLLEKGADASVVSLAGETVLMSAAMSRDVGPLEVILRHGVYDVDAVDEEERTALHDACHHGRVGAVRMLLETGADAMIRGHDGRTASDDAVRTATIWVLRPYRSMTVPTSLSRHGVSVMLRPPTLSRAFECLHSNFSSRSQ